MSTCGCSNPKPCGCKDTYNTTVNPCDLPACPTPNPCSETFSTDCAIYTGDHIVDLDIQYGDPLSTVIQKFALLFTNSGCALPTAPCQSAVGFNSTQVTGTTIKLVWLAAINATSYQVQFKKKTDTTWTLNPSVTTLYDTVGNLSLDTEYYVRVNSICNGGTCTSLTLSITTKKV